jgi:hypothetical protein
MLGIAVDSGVLDGAAGDASAGKAGTSGQAGAVGGGGSAGSNQGGHAGKAGASSGGSAGLGQGGTSGTAGKSGAAGIALGGASGGGGAAGVAGSSGQAGSAGNGGTLGLGGSNLGGSAGQGGTNNAGAAGGLAGGGSGGSVAYNPPWWDPDFKTRWPIQISNQSSSAVADLGLQVGLPVKAASIDSSPPPFNAWHIVRWDAVGKSWTSVSRDIDELEASQRIWFRLAAQISKGGVDNSYYLYANNPSAQSVPFDPLVFENFWPFDASHADWTQSGNVTYSNGALELNGTNGAGSVRSANKKLGPGNALDFLLTVVQPVTSTQSWFCGGFQRENDFQNSTPWSLWISRSGTQVQSEFWLDYSNEQTGNPVNFAVNNPRHYSIERFKRKSVYLRDFVETNSLSFGSDYNTALQLRFTANGGSRIRVDFARTRKAMDPEPSAKLLAQEDHL